MSIIISTQSNVTDGIGTGNILTETAKNLGILHGFNSRPTSKTVSAFEEIRNYESNLLKTLAGQSEEFFDQSFVGSGKKTVVGTNIPLKSGNISPIEDASVKQVFSQTPQMSVLIKKRSFSSLNNLYDPSLMDLGEKWLFRATKKLFSNKCAQIRDYEFLTKIEKMNDAGTASSKALLSLLTGFLFEKEIQSKNKIPGESESNTSADFFSSTFQLEKLMRARENVNVTTWFAEPDLPIIEELGFGSGVFETTLVTNLNTSLGIDGSGSFSFSLQNPYNMMMVTEHDIERSLIGTSLTQISNAVSHAGSLALSTAQENDGFLQKERSERGMSTITFTANIGVGSEATALIDAIGYELTKDNLDSVPEGYKLNDTEKHLFNSVLENLKTYSLALRKDISAGHPVGTSAKAQFRDNMNNARKMLRKFYLGKLIIQPMDQVHIYIDGGTRAVGQGENINESGTNSLKDTIITSVGNLLGLTDSRQVSTKLLEVAWKKFGKHLNLKDFSKLYTVNGGGVHVFAGLVTSSAEDYNSENGVYSVNVSGSSNMEWLSISRYNKQPVLHQTDGIIYDPLTPFKFKTDPATGLPIGRPILTDENKRIISKLKCNRHAGGPNKGKIIRSELDLQTDAKIIGGALYPLYDMPHGLKYRWKEGIVTMTYSMSTVDTLDKERVNPKQLRRDVGLLYTNSPFATMDVANVISTLVTGFPYNPTRFIQSALNSGTFSLDTTLNASLDYFHSLLDIQKSLSKTHGNWVPFKHSTGRREVALAIALQQRLSKKSSKLSQLRTQVAKLDDDILRNEIARSNGNVSDSSYDVTQDAIRINKQKLESNLKSIENEFSQELIRTKGIDSSKLDFKIAGNDTVFDLVNPSGEDDIMLFGDELIFMTQRRKEDVIFNKDKNLFIVSDEYDKDFDIQAFNLMLSGNSFNMWKSSWDSVLGLCKRVAEIIDFEFFVDTQGHLQLRPPQYNRTPASIFTSMLTYSKTSGIKIFPDFLEKLILSRTDNLINDIKEMEWEIKKEAAILGSGNSNEITSQLGKNFEFTLIKGFDKNLSALKALPKNEKERKQLKKVIQKLDNSVQTAVNKQTALFTAKNQISLQEKVSGTFSKIVGNGENLLYAQEDFSAGKSQYNEAVRELSKITGKPAEKYPNFDSVQIGVPKNGVVSPASDISAVVGRISSLVSRRARLITTLSSTLKNAKEHIHVNDEGLEGIVTSSGKIDTSEPLYKKIIVDDTANLLGDSSGKRFIINDDVIYSYNFREAPPEFTVCEVVGTEPLIGDKLGGSSSSLPVYSSIGVDFDLWRQYGWRTEKAFNKPFFWSAEQQCAPYAKMLLTRQRKNIVTGSITVVGNEYYQLGDVTYIANKQMLYYVNKISHNFSYESDFKTTLELNYGHPPGEYIPTPLDIIGKSLIKKNNMHGAYRTRRFGPGMGPSQDNIIATVKFTNGGSDLNSLLSHSTGHGKRNYEVLINALKLIDDAKSRGTKKQDRSKIIISYFGQSKDGANMIDTVIGWLKNPLKGNSGMLNQENPTASNNEIDKFKIDEKGMLIESEIIPYECLKKEKTSTTDQEIIRQGSTASPGAYALDNTLETIVEVILRRPPASGWSIKK